MPTLPADYLRERVIRATELGFSHAQAVAIAKAHDSTGQPVEMHQVAELIANKCPHDLAYRICS